MIYGNQSVCLYNDVVHHSRTTETRVYVGSFSGLRCVGSLRVIRVTRMPGGVKAALLRRELQWERNQWVPSHTLEQHRLRTARWRMMIYRKKPPKGAPSPVGDDTSRSVCKRSVCFFPAKSRLSLKFHNLFSPRWYLFVGGQLRKYC